MKILFTVFIALFATISSAQDMTKFKLYQPEENAEKGIASAVLQAKKENKHVLVQIGGNWCIWCARFHEFVTSDKSIDSLVQANYVVYHLNYSQENKNAELLKKYQFPQRFGFPVFLVLDGKGNLIHTQNSEYLEEGKGYSKNKVMEFFRSWTPASLDPKQYKDQ
ncbi:MAG: thioredoxin family protein [Chitinophagaceae bacterium]|nr:thioredoxin family protein [Chitinophagaceae bacterium]